MPKEINHYRIGETILLGRNVIDRSPWPGLHQDTFRVVAEVVEIEPKPSIPIGERGQDAFGEHVDFVIVAFAGGQFATLVVKMLLWMELHRKIQAL